MLNRAEKLNIENEERRLFPSQQKCRRCNTQIDMDGEEVIKTDISVFVINTEWAEEMSKGRPSTAASENEIR